MKCKHCIKKCKQLKSAIKNVPTPIKVAVGIGVLPLTIMTIVDSVRTRKYKKSIKSLESVLDELQHTPTEETKDVDREETEEEGSWADVAEEVK